MHGLAGADGPESCCGNQWLSFAVDEIRTPHNLGITIENSWDNVISKEVQVPVKFVNIQVHTRHVPSTYKYIPVHTGMYPAHLSTY